MADPRTADDPVPEDMVRLIEQAARATREYGFNPARVIRRGRRLRRRSSLARAMSISIGLLAVAVAFNVRSSGRDMPVSSVTSTTPTGTSIFVFGSEGGAQLFHDGSVVPVDTGPHSIIDVIETARDRFVAVTLPKGADLAGDDGPQVSVQYSLEVVDGSGTIVTAFEVGHPGEYVRLVAADAAHAVLWRWSEGGAMTNAGPGTLSLVDLGTGDERVLGSVSGMISHGQIHGDDVFVLQNESLDDDSCELVRLSPVAGPVAADVAGCDEPLDLARREDGVTAVAYFDYGDATTVAVDVVDPATGQRHSHDVVDDTWGIGLGALEWGPDGSLTAAVVGDGTGGYDLVVLG